MPRAIRLPEPANPLDPEIAQAMVTTRLRVPPDEHFKAVFTAEDLVNFEARDRRMLEAMSIQSQWTDWVIEALQHVDDNIAQLDAEVARRKIEIAKLKSETQEQTIVWKLIRWGAVILLGGALSALGSWLIKGAS